MSRKPAFPRQCALRSAGSGRHLFGGRKESSPQLRAPPRSFGVRPRTTPLLVFNIAFVARFLILFCKLTAALIQGRGRPSGNARRREADMCLPHPPSARTSPSAIAGGSLSFHQSDNRIQCWHIWALGIQCCFGKDFLVLRNFGTLFLI